MTDRPILFSAPMVRALLEGRKTQTRRVFKNIERTQGDQYHVWGNGGGSVGVHEVDVPATAPDYVRIAVGDRLYVREAWSGIHAFRNTPPAQRESVMTPDGPLLREDVWFWADGNPDGGDYEKLRPGMHMPRWASRLTLIVTDVCVQRLQEISDEDAIAEGPGFVGKITGEVCESATAHRLGVGPRWRNARDWYADLWDSLNYKPARPGCAWRNNPWVAAYTFTVHHQNIDQMAEAA